MNGSPLTRAVPFGLTVLWPVAKIEWVKIVAQIEPSAVLSWSFYFDLARTGASSRRSGKIVRGGSWLVLIFVSASFSRFEALRA
jgi:hypothetical protein